MTQKYTRGAKGCAWSSEGETVESQLRDWLHYERPEECTENDVDLAFDALVESDLVVITDRLEVADQWHHTSYTVRDLQAAKDFINQKLQQTATLIKRKQQ